MRTPNYIVQCVRRDGQPNEEYIYQNRSEAESHFDLFRHANQQLYIKVYLLSWVGDDTTILKELQFT